jgi:uncharacterized protein (TIGR02646 family)
MRSIEKSGEPLAPTEWKRQMQKSPQNLSYGNLPGDVKNEIKAALLKEQGYICAYTMQGLTETTAHIEHVQPQSTDPELDLDYGNMAACFPEDGGDTSYGYGAPIKADTDIKLNVNFVSPHSPGCEQRFEYDSKGNIKAPLGDNAAKNTIQILKLDHGALKDLRQRAIETHGLTLRRGSLRYPKKRKSAAQARRFAENVLQFSQDGRLEPFCTALAQVANTYADKEEARAKRMRSQHGTRH